VSQTKPTAMEAFGLNMADAAKLVALAAAVTNRRANRMRREKREKVGAALGIGKRQLDELDCVESDDLFVVLKPGSKLARRDFDDVRPLLRQSLVAGCAALETYVGDRVMELLGNQLRAKEKPKGLLSIPMTVHDWYRINDRYERTNWGVRELIEQHVRLQASPSPSKIGEMFEIVGVKKITSETDRFRKQKIGTTRDRLEVIYERRNRIAHQGDRRGRGRANLTVDEVSTDLNEVSSIASAIDAITSRT
jgi:hypothetical protein